MTRVRGFTQDDAHLFCTHDQVRGEFRATMELTQFALRSLGLSEYKVRLSKHDPSDPKCQGAAGDTWRAAEEDIRAVLDEIGSPYIEAPGEAAFYGPKAGLHRPRLHRPRVAAWHRSSLTTSCPSGSVSSTSVRTIITHRPVMIHRAPFGSLERFLAILIEHFAGAFPLWLAPEQVRMLPISDKVADYAQAVLETLLAAGFRATLDHRPEKINAKIRDAQLEKIPAMLVVGVKEAEQQAVSYRDRTAGDLGAMPLAQAIDRLKQEADARTVPPAAASPAPAAAEEGAEQHTY